MFNNKFKKIYVLILFLSFFSFGIAKANISKTGNISETGYPKTLVAGGNVIGVKLYTKGIHVVGISYVKTSDGKKYPAREAGIKNGDFIIKLDGKEINTIEKFSSYIQSGNHIKAEIVRNGKINEVTFVPELSTDDFMYKVGIWVRDSTAGIGTVTFYDEQSKLLGGLGHAITDPDTSRILTLRKGVIYDAEITGIKKSEAGEPGELNGIFASDSRKTGELFYNTPCGIFGNYNHISGNGKSYEVANSSQVTEGSAIILSSIYGDSPKQYDIEIVKVIKSSPFASKGMVIKVTDKELLQKTNGIVQGMSGSPIIQNNRIIGAVTHVFINNPTKGYGIFIGNMLSQIYNSNTN